MKTYFIIFFSLFALFSSKAQTSPFSGTWKWENENQTFYVYIMSKTLNTENKVLRIDYKMVEINNGVTIEIYSSKHQGVFAFIGAILAEKPTTASGTIYDRTHPNTTDGYEGRFSVEIYPTNPPTLNWRISTLKDNVQAFVTDNPPTGFNLPTDIILTKISDDIILYD
ncbi:MAG TPA: hypothetical protein VLZ72_05020 [Flavobacterium sp.]|nr:hypothetical protein [Flavobacterium sp.]